MAFAHNQKIAAPFLKAKIVFFETPNLLQRKFEDLLSSFQCSLSDKTKNRQKGKIQAMAASLTDAAEISSKAEAAGQLLYFTLIKEPNVALKAFSCSAAWSRFGPAWILAVIPK